MCEQKTKYPTKAFVFPHEKAAAKLVMDTSYHHIVAFRVAAVLGAVVPTPAGVAPVFGTIILRLVIISVRQFC